MTKRYESLYRELHEAAERLHAESIEAESIARMPQDVNAAPDYLFLEDI